MELSDSESKTRQLMLRMPTTQLYTDIIRSSAKRTSSRKNRRRKTC